MLDNKKSSIDVLDNSTTSTIGRSTILSDHVNNLLQDQIFLDDKSDRECLGNKAADVPVNTIPAARSDMGHHGLESGIFCHVTTSCPENVVQDYGQVYDVAHHASNILLADMQETEQLVGDTSRHPLTCFDIYRKPNPRVCLQIHSSHYRQFNLLDLFCCAIHLPRRCATSWCA